MSEDTARSRSGVGRYSRILHNYIPNIAVVSGVAMALWSSSFWLWMAVYSWRDRLTQYTWNSTAENIWIILTSIPETVWLITRQFATEAPITATVSAALVTAGTLLSAARGYQSEVRA